jgi:hypothetical protein
MTTILYIFLFAISVFLNGCRPESQLPREKAVVDQAADNEQCRMIEIQNLTVTDDALTLDYEVSNPFKDGIWVCYDTWVHGEQDVQNTSTRIDGETVWIKLRFKLESVGAFQDPPAVAKYVRLPPGESCSGRIFRNLPIKDYLREWRAEHKEHKEIVLNRVVFEIGYLRTFGPKWKRLLDSWSEKLKKESIKPKPIVSGPYYILPSGQLVTEETLDGQLREVMYLQYASFLEKEESAEVVVPDVNIPCSVAVDDK